LVVLLFGPPGCGKGTQAAVICKRFAIECFFGVPVSFTPAVGHPIAYNVAFQYHVPRFIWPEVEFNGTTWRDGTSSGHTQLFVTPGLVFGRFPIHDRLGFTVGAGVQIAATTFHQYDHNYTLTVRMPF